MYPCFEYHVRKQNLNICLKRQVLCPQVNGFHYGNLPNVCLKKRHQPRWTLKKNKQCWVTLVPRISTRIFIRTNHSERKHKEKNMRDSNQSLSWLFLQRPFNWVTPSLLRGSWMGCGNHLRLAIPNIQKASRLLDDLLLWCGSLWLWFFEPNVSWQKESGGFSEDVGYFVYLKIFTHVAILSPASNANSSSATFIPCKKHQAAWTLVEM